MGDFRHMDSRGHGVRRNKRDDEATDDKERWNLCVSDGCEAIGTHSDSTKGKMAYCAPHYYAQKGDLALADWRKRNVLSIEWERRLWLRLPRYQTFGKDKP